MIRVRADSFTEPVFPQITVYISTHLIELNALLDFVFVPTLSYGKPQARHPCKNDYLLVLTLII